MPRTLLSIYFLLSLQTKELVQVYAKHIYWSQWRMCKRGENWKVSRYGQSSALHQVSFLLVWWFILTWLWRLDAMSVPGARKQKNNKTINCEIEIQTVSTMMLENFRNFPPSQPPGPLLLSPGGNYFQHLNKPLFKTKILFVRFVLLIMTRRWLRLMLSLWSSWNSTTPDPSLQTLTVFRWDSDQRMNEWWYEV